MKSYKKVIFCLLPFNTVNDSFSNECGINFEDI